ncbi:hypothetical protein KSP39_PZI012748 [Platanthera zijinensis]|uniref:Photosystem I reaction center subunit V, chloroplastic n=1 Tax=Platanthera zijinensis TaxID=2320716 RepID=A0AAP0G4V4_9ASPA
MAAATSTALLSSASPHRSSFLGPRPIITAPATLHLSTRHRLPAAIRAELNPSVVISLSTGLSLFLGRFVFFNFQRENVAKQLPKQNGVTHFDAGDTRAGEFTALLKSNDPVGFNLIDVLAWGSLGHIVAYYILATSSNGYDPSFFSGQ